MIKHNGKKNIRNIIHNVYEKRYLIYAHRHDNTQAQNSNHLPLPSVSRVREELRHPTTMGTTVMHYEMGSSSISLSMLSDLALWLH
jgi:hypothetical protein